MSRTFTSKGRSDPWRTHRPYRPTNLVIERGSMAWSIFSTAVWVICLTYAASLWIAS